MSFLNAKSMPPLPGALADVLEAMPAGLGKKDRSRFQLVQAAVGVFSARGVGPATLQEIAAAAGMANGTVYNHFAAKEDIVQAVAYWIADTLCRRIHVSYDHITDSVERMAVGNRRYLWLAEESPAWALMMMDVGASAPVLAAQIAEYALADLRLGIRQKKFKVVTEAAGMDMIGGCVNQGMRRIAYGMAPPGHAIAITTTVLRSLGVPPEVAAAVVKRPLPEFLPPAVDEPPAAAGQPAGRGRRGPPLSGG